MPNTPAVAPDELAQLAGFLSRHHRILVVTGAGCSTDSGIPDYRAADGSWKRRPPITWKLFVDDPLARRRYWARSQLGWPMFGNARPNAAHHALVRLADRGRLLGLVTQNVDTLHQRAGSRDVIDLHGRLSEVVCLGCARRSPRAELQHRLVAGNPGWSQLTANIAPDGDADLDGHDFGSYQVPDCERCGGLLKPHVVFYGESVPRDRVAAVNGWLAQADAVLVVGSSLTVFSGYRIVRDAVAAGLPAASVTRGATRADALLDIRIRASCAQVLDALV